MTRWLTIEELAQVAFGTQPVVMVNEVHDGMRRCIRTRRVGVRLVRAAHELGVRDLAMEALPAPVPGAPESWIELPPVEGGYFVQPDMRELARTALGRGWRFVVIRGADAAGSPGVSRSTPDDGVHEQARTRAGAEPGRAGEPVPMLLVWCGNGHATRQVVADWVPMGHQFVQITGRQPYVIDQTVTINWNDQHAYLPDGAVEWLERELAPYGGTAAVRHDDAPEQLLHRDADAFVLSVDNRLEE